MAKIIKVGSQNPTFTSAKTKKAASIQTHRASNEATNPFKFTNFEGNTLQFADVFEGFKPSFKANPTNKLRIVATSVTGSMNKMKNGITESIVNFARRVHGGITSAWDYAKNTPISQVPGIKEMNEILATPINIPVIDGLTEKMAGMREKITSKIGSISDIKASIANGMTSRIESISAMFNKGNKYMGMEVSAIENAWKEEIALGGAV